MIPICLLISSSNIFCTLGDAYLHGDFVRVQHVGACAVAGLDRGDVLLVVDVGTLVSCGERLLEEHECCIRGGADGIATRGLICPEFLFLCNIF